MSSPLLVPILSLCQQVKKCNQHDHQLQSYLCIIVDSEGSARVQPRVSNQWREKTPDKIRGNNCIFWPPHLPGHIVQPCSQFLHQGVHAKLIEEIALNGQTSCFGQDLQSTLTWVCGGVGGEEGNLELWNLVKGWIELSCQDTKAPLLRFTLLALQEFAHRWTRWGEEACRCRLSPLLASSSAGWYLHHGWTAPLKWSCSSQR